MDLDTALAGSLGLGVPPRRRWIGLCIIKPASRRRSTKLAWGENMKPSLTTTLAAITLAFAPAFARAQEQSKPAEPAHKTVLLTGCLQPGADAATFKLTHASPSQRPSAEAPPAASAATVGTVGETRDYELTSDSSSKTDLKLSTYIGRRVEVTARPLAAAPAPSSGRAEAGLTAESKANEPKPERLMVTAIARRSGSCP